MHTARTTLDYLRRYRLVLSTAESCTAGMVISLLADVEGCGAQIDCGYVVYSPDAKRRLLHVRQQTIDAFGLTSEEVAREMATGALRNSAASVAIANTGVAGPDAVDGIAPGTVCLAWAFEYGRRLHLFSRTVQLPGDRQQVRRAAAETLIGAVPEFYQQLLAGTADS